MVPNHVALALKAPVLCRFTDFTRGPVLCFGRQAYVGFPVRITRIGTCSSCHSYSYLLHASNAVELKCLGHRGLRLRHSGLETFRISAVSNGGSAGTGGTGGSGDENSGSRGGGGDDGSSGGNNWSFLSWYLGLLAKYPVLVKSITSALLTLIGDLICQLVIEQVPSLDLKRTFVFTLLGMVLVGPTLHFWYLYLSKLVTSPGASGAFLRLLLDQFVFSPAFIGVFLATLVTLEGRPSQVVPKLQQEWFSSVIANWKLWIPFQFLNFRFVPQQFQVLAANVIALVWNVILSFKAHKEILPREA